MNRVDTVVREGERSVRGFDCEEKARFDPNSCFANEKNELEHRVSHFHPSLRKKNNHVTSSFIDATQRALLIWLR